MAMEVQDLLKDAEYKNWLKVGLALLYMKEGLHSFVQNEVNAMHESLAQAINTGSKSQCTSCTSQNIIRNRERRWEFHPPCPSSLCDDWMKGLLSYHKCPTSGNIFWDNCNVTSWASKPWECAKLFMPKGQQPSNTGPVKTDAQALLSLMSNCKYFHRQHSDVGKLSEKGQNQALQVSLVRNRVMHAGDMRLTETEMRNSIEEIIQLLEDPIYLVSLEECESGVVKIIKIRDDEIDILLSQNIRNVTQGENLRTLEEDVKTLSESMSYLKQKSEAQSATFYKLQEVFAEMNKKKEVRPNRRSESDGLRRLKNQTEDKLDTLGRLECIPTTQMEEATKMLEGKSAVVIRGNPGEGKTIMALHLIDNEIYRDRRVVLFGPRNWEEVDTDWVDIIILEDIFGQFDLDRGRLQEWIVHLPSIQEHVDAGKLQVIITTRVDILSKACSMIGSLKFFSDDLAITLSSDQLQISEKMSILTRELLRHDRNMKEDGKEKCITNFKGLIGFPQCCSIFAGDNRLFGTGPEFFKSPEKFFVANITVLEATRFLSLAFLFCNGEIYEEYLSPKTMPMSSRHLLQELATHLHISKKNASITLLRDVYASFLELYVVKSISYNYKEKSCIRFTHTTVCEAVGQVLGDRCLEMVVKYGNSEYLYQRTYTAEIKDNSSQNMFIPASMYGLLAERMVHDIMEKGLVRSVVKHSAFKQYDFVMKLKAELHKGNNIMDFFMAKPYSVSRFHYDLSEGECCTFMQCILQGDADVVRLMYNHFVEFLECAHNDYNSECWKCSEKQKLLELALYYKHFGIADKLITMKTCYTHVSLCNAARHDDLERIQTILETLKSSQVFNRGCKEAKDALCRAFISGNQNLIEFLLKEGIILNTWHIVDAVEHGDINVVMKVVEHLKCHNKWTPYQGQDGAPRHIFTSGMHLDSSKHFQFQIPCFTALHMCYCNEKFDIGDYLQKHEVKVSLCMLSYVSQNSTQQAVARVIQDLKVTGTWDPHCDDASKVLENAYSLKKYDVCDLLVQEGVSLTMKNLSGMVDSESLISVKKAIEHLKDTDNWYPKSDDACETLETAYRKKKNDVCDLLFQEGVSPTMKHIHQVVLTPLAYVKTVVKLLKDNNNWDPKCDDASEALKTAHMNQKYDACKLLVQEGVSLMMKNLPSMVYSGSLKIVEKTIQHLKDTNNFDPKCDDALKALENAYRKQNYDVCDLLIQVGVSLTMKNLPGVVCNVSLNMKTVEKTIQHLKDTDKWDPKCDDASKSLENAFREQKYNVCDLLVQEGVTLTMKNLLGVVVYNVSLVAVVKTIQHLKDTANWDPKCDDASEALKNAYGDQNYDVCDLLVLEGVSLAMKHLSGVLYSLVVAKKVIQHLKDTNNWDPKCDDATEALETACVVDTYDVCALLVQEGVPLTLTQFASVKPCIQFTDGTFCEDVEHVLGDCCLEMVVKYVSSEYLYESSYTAEPKNGTSQNMFIPVSAYALLAERIVHDIVKKGLVRSVVKHSAFKQYDFVMKLKEELHRGNNIMDFFMAKPYSVSRFHYDLSEGECCTFMQCILQGDADVVRLMYNHFVEFLECAHNDYNSECWKCSEKQKLLELALYYKHFDIADKLIIMKTCYTHVSLCNAARHDDLERIQTILETLKSSQVFNRGCKEAKDALCRAFISGNQNLIEFLLKEGIILNTWHIVDAVKHGDINVVMKVVEHLKCHNKWTPYQGQDGAPRHIFTSGMHLDSSKHFQFQIPCFTALHMCYCNEKFDIGDYLQKHEVKVSLCMLSYVSPNSTQQAVARVIQDLKVTGIWDPHCDDASKVLENAYSLKKYDVCDLLVQEGVSLTMKNLSGMVDSESLISVKKAIEHLKDTDNWYPKSDDACETLETAYRKKKNDVCDLLFQEGVSPTMKHIHQVVLTSLAYVKTVVKLLKDNNNWDPKCDDASEALKTAYMNQKYDACKLLVQEGVSLMMKNLPSMVYSGSLKIVEKTIQHLKDTNNFDPKCDDALKALENAYRKQNYDVCDLLIQVGVSLTMKNLPGVVCNVSLNMKTVEKTIQHLKDTDKWDPKCDDASKSLENAFRELKYNVCDLLVQEGVTLTMKNLLGVVVYNVSLVAVVKTIQHLKDTANWNPKCDDASEALKNAYGDQNYDVCDLLVLEGVSLAMKHLSGVLYSLVVAKKAIQHLKDTYSWDPRCEDASKLLETACVEDMHDVYALLIHQGVSLTMKNLPGLVHSVSVQSVKNAIQYLKDTHNWDSKCDGASEALTKAFRDRKYDMCDLLIQEGVLLKMKHLPGVVCSVSGIQKAIQLLKNTASWDPKCDDASKTLETAYIVHRFDVCSLLVQEGVQLTMKQLPYVVCSVSVVQKAIQHLKDTDNWDPNCDDASKALENAYGDLKYDVCDLLVQEGVLLKTKASSRCGMQCIFC